MTEEDAKLLYTAETDPEFGPWLRHNVNSESPFIRALQRAERTGSSRRRLHSLNASVFDNTFAETKIRYPSSIVSQREPGWPIGLFAEPVDPVTHRLPGQFRLDVPHIFISEKLRGIAPIDEWVLLHEMCHHKVPNHGPDFIAQVKQALHATGWRTLISGFC